MNHIPLRGVNLGGWLVLERWMTPSVFKGMTAVDEHSFCQQANAGQRRRLRQFRDSFITEADFLWLAQQGIEAVRLPIGFWLFGDVAPYQPTVRYVDLAFQWARTHGLKILLDFHGAPGSQNGKDHSGQVGDVQWDNTASLHYLTQIVARYGHRPALLGIALLNEPGSSLSATKIENYYRQAYQMIRAYCPATTWIVYSDGYQPRRWRQIMPHVSFPQLYIDSHYYQVFGVLDKRLPARLNLLRSHWRLPWYLTKLHRYHPVIIGEWSLALPRADAATIRRYGQLQLRAYQQTAAWFFWNYRTEAGGGWNFRDCCEQGLLPDLRSMIY